MGTVTASLARVLVAAAAAALVVAALLPDAAPARSPGPLLAVWATNGDTPYADDRPLLTTISPNGDGFRDRARIRFRLRRTATVTVVVGRTKARLYPVYRHSYRFGPGLHTVEWAPRPGIPPRTYLVRLRVGRRTYGAARPTRGLQTGPVVRVQGIDAAFTRESYAPGSLAGLRVSTDADELTVQLFHAGPEFVPSPPPGTMTGLPAGDSRPPHRPRRRRLGDERRHAVQG